MTSIKHLNSWIVFDYKSNLDGQNLSKFYNVIEIVDASDDVFESIEQADGMFIFDGYEFPNMFETTGFQHTFSVCGQWHWLIDKFVKDLSVKQDLRNNSL